MPAWLKALVLWFGILVLAVLNGMLREGMLIPAFGDFIALILSGALLAFCIFVVAWLAVPWWGSLTATQWWWVGAFWFALTIVFELGFGRFAQHKAWVELLEAYTFAGGNIWPLVLAATLVSPRFAAGVRGLSEHRVPGKPMHATCEDARGAQLKRQSAQ